MGGWQQGDEQHHLHQDFAVRTLTESVITEITAKSPELQSSAAKLYDVITYTMYVQYTYTEKQLPVDVPEYISPCSPSLVICTETVWLPLFLLL